jgi:hypothetical protein
LITAMRLQLHPSGWLHHQHLPNRVCGLDRVWLHQAGPGNPDGFWGARR